MSQRGNPRATSQPAELAVVFKPTHIWLWPQSLCGHTSVRDCQKTHTSKKTPTFLALTCDFLHSLLPSHQRQTFRVDSCQRMSVGALRQGTILPVLGCSNWNTFVKESFGSGNQWVLASYSEHCPGTPKWTNALLIFWTQCTRILQVIFHLTARKIAHFLIYMRASICSLSKHLQNTNAHSGFLKSTAEKEMTQALLAEFYLLGLVRMGYSV